MSNPIASFSGLASGIQWRDIVDQLVQVERSRTVTPLEQQIELRQQQKTAWSAFKTLTEKLNDAAPRRRERTRWKCSSWRRRRRSAAAP